MDILLYRKLSHAKFDFRNLTLTPSLIFLRHNSTKEREQKQRIKNLRHEFAVIKLSIFLFSVHYRKIAGLHQSTDNSHHSSVKSFFYCCSFPVTPTLSKLLKF